MHDEQRIHEKEEPIHVVRCRRRRDEVSLLCLVGSRVSVGEIGAKILEKRVAAESYDRGCQEEVRDLLDLVIVQESDVPVLFLDERVHRREVGDHVRTPAAVLDQVRLRLATKRRTVDAHAVHKIRDLRPDRHGAKKRREKPEAEEGAWSCHGRRRHPQTMPRDKNCKNEKRGSWWESLSESVVSNDKTYGRGGCRSSA